MTIEQIKAVVKSRAAEQAGIVVHTLTDEFYAGPCVFAGKNKFRVNTVSATIFFAYDEVEAVI